MGAITNAGTITVPVETITVPLIEKVARELARTRERRKLSITDVVNRAITLNEFLDEELASGAELHLHRPDGTVHLIRFL